MHPSHYHRLRWKGRVDGFAHARTCCKRRRAKGGDRPGEGGKGFGWQGWAPSWPDASLRMS